MASLWALLTATQAAGAFTWLTRLARGLGPDDPRSMDVGGEPGGEGEVHSSGTGERTEAEPTSGSDNADRTARDDSATGAGRPIHPSPPANR